MKRKFMILDGAMGTMLQEQGMPAGAHPEVFGCQHPEIVKEIHSKYIQAGSQVLYTNTFGANRNKLKGTGYSVDEVVRNAVECAKAAAGGKAEIALDIGPIGEMLEPLGTLSLEEAYEIYREEILAGAAYGVDRIVLETFTDLSDLKMAFLAAKENCSLPIWTTMSFEENGRTFLGTTVESMASVMTAMGAEAIGINCSLGPKEILPLVRTMSQWTDLPLIVKPNAGLPNPETGEYEMTPAEFSELMRSYEEYPLLAVGGCCGTTPEYISAIADFSCKSVNRTVLKRGICSATKMVPMDGLHVIGERLNPTGKKSFQQALRERDIGFLQRVALEQEESGAEILDLNVGLPGEDEPELMKWAVKGIQSVTGVPLQIDSSNPKAVEAGLRVYTGRAIVNSVNGNEETQKALFPIIKKYGAAVIGLTLDHEGIPRSCEKRVAIAEQIVNHAEQAGIPREDVLIDCLTLTVSAEQSQAMETLKAVREVHDRLRLHTALGVSNISFGLPQRIQITERFLVEAIACGLDFPIVNPNQKEIMDAIVSCRVLSGQDEGSAAYIQRFTQNENRETPKETAINTLEEAVIKGLRQEAAEMTKILLEKEDELSIINGHLIPALDDVGAKFERKILFLPQLINAANAACSAFDILRERLRQKGEGAVSRGSVLLATVEGDIHDIGKNIVKVILENYGYTVTDLGKDVPSQKIVEHAVQKNIPLVGLSALMTTTVPAMEKTIRELRKAGWNGKIMVGGAVLTPEYAQRIGADYYAKDARESALIAKEVFENK